MADESERQCAVPNRMKIYCVLLQAVWLVVILESDARAQPRDEGQNVERKESSPTERELILEERIKDAAILDSWTQDLENYEAPFEDNIFSLLGSRIVRLGRESEFMVNRQQAGAVLDAYREKMMSDPQHVEYFGSRLLNERSAVVRRELNWNRYSHTCSQVFGVLKNLRTEESARFLGSLLWDTKGSLPDDRYPGQARLNHHSNASLAVRALWEMGLEDPPEVEGRGLYQFPHLHIPEWQEWWAEVERGEREIRFKEKGAVAAAGRKPDVVREVDRQRAPRSEPAGEDRVHREPAGWTGWIVPWFFAGLGVLYLVIRRLARE